MSPEPVSVGPLQKQVAARIQEILAERQVPLRTFAADTGLGQLTLVRLVKGEKRMDLDQLAIIAANLGMTPKDLLP